MWEPLTAEDQRKGGAVRELAEGGQPGSVALAPDVVERFGRRWKMEYVGMASVFAILFLFCFRNLLIWQQSLAAMAATYFLFLGLKKKTRDHLLTSLLMFAVAAVAYDGIAHGRWALPFMFFGACLWALEGYLERRRNRIYALPFVLAVWALVGPSWVAGLLFVSSYLACPCPQRPRLRRRLAVLVALGGLAAGALFLARSDFHALLSASRLPLSGVDLVLLLSLGLPTLLCLLAFWPRLAMPHRLNAVLFGLLAPWDLRAFSVFTIAAAVVLAATALRNSAESVGLRTFFKRAEWYYFWLVLVVAVVGAVEYLG